MGVWWGEKREGGGREGAMRVGRWVSSGVSTWPRKSATSGRWYHAGEQGPDGGRQCGELGGAWGFAVGQTGVNVAFTVLKKPAPLFSTLRWRHHAMVFQALSATTRVVRVGPCWLCPEGSVGSSSFALLLPGDVLCWSLRLGPGRGTLSCSVPSQCRGLVSVLRRLLPNHGPASPEKLQVK